MQDILIFTALSRLRQDEKTGFNLIRKSCFEGCLEFHVYEAGIRVSSEGDVRNAPSLSFFGLLEGMVPEWWCYTLNGVEEETIDSGGGKIATKTALTAGFIYRRHLESGIWRLYQKKGVPFSDCRSANNSSKVP